jgi:hypothetical protein
MVNKVQYKQLLQYYLLHIYHQEGFSHLHYKCHIKDLEHKDLRHFTLLN